MTRVSLSSSLLANVNQVCHHCKSGEVEHWPVTPPAPDLLFRSRGSAMVGKILVASGCPGEGGMGFLPDPAGTAKISLHQRYGYFSSLARRLETMGDHDPGHPVAALSREL